MHSCNIKPCLAFTTIYHPIPLSRLDISMVKQQQQTLHMFAYTYPAPRLTTSRAYLAKHPHSIVLDKSSAHDILQLTLQTHVNYYIHYTIVMLQMFFTLNVE